jgi:hypothetical protein
MTATHVVSQILINLFFGVCGWFCIFRPTMLVNMGQKNYARSKLARSAPNSNMVFKPWYPTLIRCAGIFIWLWAAAFDFVAFKARFR